MACSPCLWLCLHTDTSLHVSSVPHALKAHTAVYFALAEAGHHPASLSIWLQMTFAITQDLATEVHFTAHGDSDVQHCIY